MGLLGTCHNILPNCLHQLKLEMQACEKSDHLIQTNHAGVVLAIFKCSFRKVGIRLGV